MAEATGPWEVNAVVLLVCADKPDHNPISKARPNAHVDARILGLAAAHFID
jgi:hypothetical protein